MKTPHRVEVEAPPRRQRLLRAYCWLLLALLAYVLSTGPMYWEVYEAYHANGSAWVALLYYPVVVACEYEPVAAWFDWYVGLWIGI
jgi:hypothetical protein